MFDALGNLVAFDLFGLAPDSPAGAALQFFVMDVAKILVLLTTVIYLMGWLRALLTPEKVRAMMRGRSGPGARLMAVGLGAVTPFCSCSSIPLFIGFVEAGIPLGVTLSFLIASPMVNQVAVVVLAGVIGWEMTLIYVATGLTVAFVGGYVLQAFRLERWVEDYVWKIQMGEAVPQVEHDNSLRARHDYAWNEVRQIVGRIWKYVFIGVGIGATDPRLCAGRLRRPDRRRRQRAVGHRRGAGRRADVFRRGRHHSGGRGPARQGRPARHRAGFHDGGDRPVAAGDADPAQGGQMAAARYLRGLSRHRIRAGRRPVQRPEECHRMSNELHPSIVALVSLAANIAANHPKQGLCQVDRLKDYGVSREQIDAVIEIARHIRDEAAQNLDASFDEAYAASAKPADPFARIAVVESGAACCTPTPSGKSCC
jgi:hypothetical protein